MVHTAKNASALVHFPLSRVSRSRARLPLLVVGEDEELEAVRVVQGVRAEEPAALQGGLAGRGDNPEK